MDINEFGLTNNCAYFNAANLYREAAIADGWIVKPTYEGEPIECHATLERDGFKMFVKARTSVEVWKYECGVNIWGPDGMTIRPPDVYDWNTIRNSVNRCNYCQKTTSVERVGFAGRACADCLSEQRRIQEYPGWTL